MNRVLTMWLLLGSGPVLAQGPNPKPPIYGVHYSFERIVAERTVNDAYDKGKIRLVSYVYRPLAKDSREVVVVLHGSAGGMVIHPAEPNLGALPSLNFFLERGYTVVIPMRRGRAESSGHYVEECPYQAGKCTLADYRELTRPGLSDAMRSTEAVIDQVVLQRLKPKKGRFVLWGGSRGAVLALQYAAAHPAQVRGVVAASAGWLSVVDKWPSDENGARMLLQRSIFAEAARYPGSTLWVYADGDPFYAETVSRQFFEAYIKSGGRGRYVQLRGHNLANGHVPPIDLWHDEAARFLGGLPQ